MKKLFIILFAFLILAGCSKTADNEAEQTNPETEPQNIETIAATISDSQPETETEVVETETPESVAVAENTAVDLHGNWIQEGYEEKEAYMTASISDDVIEIYWYMDGGNTIALYWSGTFIESDINGDYTWDSINNKDKTGMALLASSDDTKTFSYSNGKISYSQSAMGITTTIYLIPNN